MYEMDLDITACFGNNKKHFSCETLLNEIRGCIFFFHRLITTRQEHMVRLTTTDSLLQTAYILQLYFQF